MPLVFRKVYGDVDGKRQVVKTIKLSGDDARADIAERKKQREITKQNRTMKNFLFTLFAPKIEKQIEDVVEEKSQKISKDLSIPYDPVKKEFILPENFLDFRTTTDTEKVRRRLRFENEKLRTERIVRNLTEDKRIAFGSRSDLTSMGLLGFGTNLETKINQVTLQNQSNTQNKQSSVFSGLLDFLGQ